MRDIVFRTLKKNEIEVRPAQIKDGKATLLLYIDSRSVVTILNETVGNMNWNMEFYSVNNQPVGRLGIWDEDKKMFIYKSDTGSESNIEASKGQISDVYKRCLARWGVTELYSAPRILVDDDGYGCRGYKVAEIEYDTDRNITKLILTDIRGNKVFEWSKGIRIQQPTLMAKNEPTEGQNLEILRRFCTAQKNTGGDIEELKKFYAFFEKRCDNWRGDFLVDRLYNNWISRKRS